MRRFVNLILIAILPIVTATSLTTQIADAQTSAESRGSGLAVTPPRSELNAKLGEKFTKKISLDNLSDSPRKIEVLVQNFASADEYGKPALTNKEDVYSLEKWIKVTPALVVIEPRKRQDFELEIEVPQNASPGGHFAAISFSPRSEGGDTSTNVASLAQISSLILLRVPGDVKESASIDTLNICNANEKITPECKSTQSAFTHGPLLISTRVKNSGNVHVAPKGNVTIRNMFGKKVKTIEIAPNNVLPESVRRFEVSWSPKASIGLYKTEVNLTYGTSEQKLVSTKSFWVIPIRSIVTIIIGTIAFFILIWLPRKRWKKAIKALASSEE